MTTIEEERIYPGHTAAPGYLGWTPAIAGALIGTALSAVLIALGTAIGLEWLFRPARRTPKAETAMDRAEARRILLTSSSHTGVATEDRAYLVQLVSGVTGLSGPDAERRIDNVIAGAKTAIARSRRSAIIAAFSVAASILLGAVVAWFAACEGGRHRDGAEPGWLTNRPLTAREQGIP